MKSFFKKIALVLVLAMVVTMMPANLRVASAADDDGPQMYPTLRFYLGGDETGKYSDAARYAKTWNKDGYDVVGQFESSNPEVAKVNKKGLVTPLKVGTTTITATFKSTTGGEDVIRECKVTVKQNAVEAGISDNSKAKLEAGIEVGKTFQTVTYREDADGNRVWKGTDVITSPARFTSSNEAVFTVTKKGGYIKAVGIGEATLNVWAVQSEGRLKNEDGTYGEYLPVTPVKEYTVKVLPPEPSVVTYDRAVLTAGDLKLIADGVRGTIITFTLYSGPNMVDMETKDVQVRLASTYGTLAFDHVTLQNGTASVLYTTPILTEEATTTITAIIVSAEDTEEGHALINTQAAPIDIKLVPYTGANTVLDENGATVLSSTVVMADRITMYFNKPVDATDFMYLYDDEWHVEPKLGTKNDYKFVLEIEDNIPQTQDKMIMAEFTQADIANILQNTDTSLTFVLKEDRVKKPIPGLPSVFTDNSKYALNFKDKSKNGVVDSKDVIGYVTDAILPSLLSVTQYEGSMTTLLVTFSEPMPGFDATQVVIDGLPLKASYNQPTYKGCTGSTSKVDRLPGTEDSSRKSFLIKLGKDSNNDQVYFPAGAHSLTINNVGDYAYLTDNSNFIATATLDFNIIENTTVPDFDVIVQSPEQYLLQFNCEVNEERFNLNKVVLQTGIKGWDKDCYTVEFLSDDDNTSPGKSQILVEVKKDWTKVLSEEKQNYYNYDFTISIAKEEIINLANGKKNGGDLNKPLKNAVVGGVKMTEVDHISPSLVEIKEVDEGEIFAVKFDEPIQFTLDGHNRPVWRAGNITPSSAQDVQWGGVPIITAQFVSNDNKLSQTVDGEIVGIDRQNYTLRIKAKDKLNAGTEYTLYVRSVSDDIGNTSPTLFTKFTTIARPTVVKKFQIAGVWADAHLDTTGIYELNQVSYDWWDDTRTSFDAIYVEFTKPFATAGGTKTVLTTTNWSINGSPLPAGSYIVGNIIGDSRLTGVTIVLPGGTIKDINATVITVSKTVIALKNNNDEPDELLAGENRFVTQYPTIGFDFWGDPITLYSAGFNSHLHDENSPYLGKIGTFAARYQDNKIEFNVATGSDKVEVFFYEKEEDDGSKVKVASGAAVNVKIDIPNDRSDTHADSLEKVFVERDDDGYPVYESIIKEYVLNLYGFDKKGNRSEKPLATAEPIKFEERDSLSTKGVTFDIAENFKWDKDGIVYTGEFQVELKAVARNGYTSSVFNFSKNRVTYDVKETEVSAPEEKE